MWRTVLKVLRTARRSGDKFAPMLYKYRDLLGRLANVIMLDRYNSRNEMYSLLEKSLVPVEADRGGVPDFDFVINKDDVRAASYLWILFAMVDRHLINLQDAAYGKQPAASVASGPGLGMSRSVVKKTGPRPLSDLASIEVRMASLLVERAADVEDRTVTYIDYRDVVVPKVRGGGGSPAALLRTLNALQQAGAVVKVQRMQTAGAVADPKAGAGQPKRRRGAGPASTLVWADATEEPIIMILRHFNAGVPEVTLEPCLESWPTSGFKTQFLAWRQFRVDSAGAASESVDAPSQVAA